MLETDLLQNFLAVLDHGGFTAAARAVNSTQSTVSAKLARLEEQAGHRLLERNKRGIVSLTPEGEAIERMAREIVRLQTVTLRRINERPVSGVVRLGMSDDIASGRRYPALLSHFCERQPGIRLEVSVGAGSALLKSLNSGDLDHVLCKTNDETPAHAVELWRERLVWVGGNGGWSTDRSEVRLVTFTPPCRYRERAVDILTRHGQPWRVVYESPSLFGVQAAIGAGLGVTILPASLVPDDKERPQANNLPSAGTMAFALISREELDDPANLLFAELLRDLLPPYTSPA